MFFAKKQKKIERKRIIPRSRPSRTAGSLICISLKGEGEDKQIRKEKKRRSLVFVR